MSFTVADLAKWLDDEYVALSARPHRGGPDGEQEAGRRAQLAELAAICRAGTLPAHSRVSLMWAAVPALENVSPPTPAIRVWCVECGKASAGRRPAGGDGTLLYPRRHDHDGEPCPGNLIEASWSPPAVSK